MHRTEGTNFIKDSNGNNSFTDSPPATTITAAILNSIQEEICTVIENSGLNVLTQATDTKNQLWQAISQATSSFEYIVSSQSTFNALFERVAANQYKIKDDYSSVFIKFIAGGYACYGGGSFLSGGDTWGQIFTNNCKLIICEGGTIFQMGDTPSYFSINTADFIGYNLRMDGLGGAAAINYSFYLNNTGIKLINPMSYNRKSNTNMTVFYSNVTDNMQFILNPIINTIDSTGGTIKGFYQCYNIQNPYITLLEGSSGITTIFDACKRINNYLIYNCTNSAEHVYCFNACYNIDNGEINTVAHDGAVASKNAIIFKSCIGVNKGFYQTGLTTNGAGGIASIFDSNTFKPNHVNILEITDNYTLDENDEYDVIEVAHSSTTKLVTITIPSTSFSYLKSKKLKIKNTGVGLTHITCTNKISLNGNLLSTVKLFMEDDYVNLIFSTSEIKVTDKYISIITNMINTNSWTSRDLGCAFTYDNKSAAVDLTGQHITEATSNQTAVILYDSGGVGASGVMYVYNIAIGTGVWTNNRQVSCGVGGYTFDVDEPSGSSKNIDYDIYHNLGLGLGLFKFHIYISSDGTLTNTTEVSFQVDDPGAGNGGGGNVNYLDSNSIRIATGVSAGFIYWDKTHTLTVLAAQDYYYNFVFILR